MADFGGVLKNQSIGVASADSKAYVHTAGKVHDASQLWGILPRQDAPQLAGIMHLARRMDISLAIGRGDTDALILEHASKIRHYLICCGVSPVCFLKYRQKKLTSVK